MLSFLNKINDIKIYDVNDREFTSFGRVINGLDTSEIIKTAKTIKNPETATLYKASEEKFEKLGISNEIAENFFGQMPTQIGYCWGYSSFLNGAEWHTSSEINIAVTPLVLILGHLWDIKDNKIDSSMFKAFYLKEGTAIETYATTLHFCPCQVQKEGFGLVVALPYGTNTELDKNSENPLLFKKNKWIIAHNDNLPLIQRGVVPGISGVNIKIDY